MSISKWLKQDPSDVVRREIDVVYPRLWRYCLALTSNASQADDLAQAACLRALEKAEHFEVGTFFDRWIFRLTQRLWFNELRKNAIRAGSGLVNIDEIELRDNALDPESNLLGREVVMDIMHLPEAQRVAVILVYVEGHSYRDAAMILDIPVGTIMSRLAVARSKLAQKFRTESDVG